MAATLMRELIWGAGMVQEGIVLANIPLPGRLRVRERLAPVLRFLRQIFYVHWIYIVVVVGLALGVFYYDKEMRKENRGLDMTYLGVLVVLVVIFGVAAIRAVA